MAYNNGVIKAPNYNITSGDESKLSELGDGKLVLLENDENYPIIEIEDYTFRNSLITSINITSTIKTIGSSAFYNCDNLTSFVVPSTITDLGKSAFENCSNLTSVTIQSNVTTLLDSMFNGCNKLKDVNLPDSLEAINRYVFSQCSSLETINLPQSITNIGYKAFYDCDSLVNVILPSALKTIESSAFSYCNNLETVTCFENLTTIAGMCFQYCPKLTSFGPLPLQEKTIELPYSINSIGSYAFGFNPLIETLYIPDKISVLKGNALKDNPLNTVYFAGTYLHWDAIKESNSNIYDCENVIYTYYSDEDNIIEDGNTYAIIFDLNNGSSPLVYNNYKLNQIIDYPSDPKKEGYAFVGWNTIERRESKDMVI